MPFYGGLIKYTLLISWSGLLLHGPKSSSSNMPLIGSIFI